MVDTIQKNALQMVADFKNIFKKYIEYVPFRTMEVSFPFEGYLRNSSYLDRKVFAASYFEDMVYGANDKIKIEDFINQTIPYMAQGENRDYIPIQSVLYMMKDKNRLTKALVIFILDKKTFKQIVGRKLLNNRFLYFVGRKMVRVYDKIFKTS